LSLASKHLQLDNPARATLAGVKQMYPGRYARCFVPQSRPRIFIVGARVELGVDVEGLVKNAIAALPVCNTRLIDILDVGAKCRAAEKIAEILALMAPKHLEKIERMRRAGDWVANGPATRTRRLSRRECARLMGLGDDYVLPANDVEAFNLVGDGLVLPVVRHLATHVLEPILKSCFDVRT
jgi:site-specific DNA-cytosine methylase